MNLDTSCSAEISRQMEADWRLLVGLGWIFFLSLQGSEELLLGGHLQRAQAAGLVQAELSLHEEVLLLPGVLWCQ